MRKLGFISLIVLTELICATKLVGFSEALSKIDRATLNRAKTRCIYYYPDSPCLVKLIKKEEHVYHAICGVNNDKK